MSKIITINGLKKKYEHLSVFDNFSIDVNKGDILAIFGPNGCGKSTLLNILAGITFKDGGDIRIDSDGASKLNYIFQNYRDSLFPWMDNYRNLAFPLELKGESDELIEKKINELVKISKLKIDLKKYPYQLSGGQQQILAFLRALVTSPEILLIDEPFSALDYENGLLLREFIQKYYELYKPTIIIITHDIEEAVHLANKIVVLSRNPAEIVKLVKNDSEYPREIDFLRTGKFSQIKEDVLVAFRQGARL